MRGKMPRCARHDACPERSRGVQPFPLALVTQIYAHPIGAALPGSNMPMMNGVKVMTRLRDEPHLRDIPVVVAYIEGSEPRIPELPAAGRGRPGRGRSLLWTHAVGPRCGRPVRARAGAGCRALYSAAVVTIT